MFYTVPPAEPLADRLVSWLLAQYKQKPQALAEILVFLPTRRAIRTVREAFLRVGQGQAMLLPQLVATGDVDEALILRHTTLSPALMQELGALLPTPPPMERLLLLQELVWEHGQKMIPRLHDREAALDLAVNLAELMDEMDREYGDWTKLDTLVPEDFAEHWQQTLEFLKIIREYWPELEAERGWMRPWQRRNELLKILLKAWEESSPQQPVIAAGTTGSVAAVGELLRRIHQLPKGSVILPGFESSLPEGTLPLTHPQAGMQEILVDMEVSPFQVEELPGEVIRSETQRHEFLSLAMVPVQMTDAWRGAEFTKPDSFYCLEMANSQESSFAAALLMREMLEQTDKTAAFITPDRQLARAVAARLARWGIVADDSAGQPLPQTPQGVFLFLLLEAVRYGLSPVSLLALMKHPLFTMGLIRSELSQQVRGWEIKVLRGLASPHWEKVKRETKKQMLDHVPLLEALEQKLAPLLVAFETIESHKFDALVTLLVETAEALTQNSAGECQLWQGEGASTLSSFFSKMTASEVVSDIAAEELPGMLRALMRGEVVRTHYGTHPRLQILSPMEARLQRYDRVILADMNEGGWPEIPDADPWMNHDMRRKLGLPSPDKRIGQQAHDFIQQAAGGEVLMLRTAKSGGAETVPSRLVQRIEVLMESTGDDAWRSHPVQDWVRQLLTPQSTPAATRPTPKPPVETRPRELSFTRFERLMQDPYSIYAQKVLKLKKLDALDPEPSHREFGSLVHDVLEKHFTTKRPMMDCAEEVFAAADLGYIADSLWWPRFERIAKWAEAQPMPLSMQCEIKGEWKFAAPAGEFTLTARVDRLEESATGFSIIDYKTGAPPAAEWMRQGVANQLNIAAVMAKEGSFGKHLQDKPVEALEYWKLGGKEGGEVKAFALTKEESLEEAVQNARDALPKVIAAYDKPEKAYESIPEYRFKPRYNDYEQLARIQEWLD